MRFAFFFTLVLLIALGPTPSLTRKWWEKKERKKDSNRNVAHRMRIHPSLIPKRPKKVVIKMRKMKYHCRPWAAANLAPCAVGCLVSYYAQQLACPLNDRACVCNTNHLDFFKHSRCLMEQCEASEVHFTLNELSHRCDLWKELGDEQKHEHDKVSQHRVACEVNLLSEEVSTHDQ
ncbi:hypothetical protein E4U21_005676 [Claviceps maximensis]|nr:hypothetical protein E4U21_005676 [Claviceps maximensis]